MAVVEAELQTQPGNHVEQVTMTNSVTFQVIDGGTFRQIQLKKTTPAYRAVMAIFEAEWKRLPKANQPQRVRRELKGLEDSLTGYYKPSCSRRSRTARACRSVSTDAPEFYGKPKIIKKDNVIVIKARAKPRAGELKAEWFKDDKPIRRTDRVKITQKKDAKDNEGTQYTLTIAKPTKKDEAKYRIVIKNAKGSNQQTLRLVCG
ncbi:immunoglobulin I-set domain-containing protein [Aphelenchoides avenae]|nr:immunoglobulin I-set domain-containing protein [Aphelenchus avenae]